MPRTTTMLLNDLREQIKNETINNKIEIENIIAELIQKEAARIAKERAANPPASDRPKFKPPASGLKNLELPVISPADEERFEKQKNLAKLQMSVTKGADKGESIPVSDPTLVTREGQNIADVINRLGPTSNSFSSVVATSNVDTFSGTDIIIDRVSIGALKSREFKFEVKFQYNDKSEDGTKFDSIGLIQLLTSSERLAELTYLRSESPFKPQDYPILDGVVNDEYLWYSVVNGEDGYKKELIPGETSITLKLKDTPTLNFELKTGASLIEGKQIKKLILKDEFLIMLCECRIKEENGKEYKYYHPTREIWQWREEINVVNSNIDTPTRFDFKFKFDIDFSQVVNTNLETYFGAFKKFRSDDRCGLHRNKVTDEQIVAIKKAP